MEVSQQARSPFIRRRRVDGYSGCDLRRTRERHRKTLVRCPPMRVGSVIVTRILFRSNVTSKPFRAMTRWLARLQAHFLLVFRAVLKAGPYFWLI